MEAQFQENLNWLHQEIDKIKDPNFLKKVTNLLKERPSAQSSESWEKQRLIEGALASNEDIKAGRVHTIEEVEKMLESKGL